MYTPYTEYRGLLDLTDNGIIVASYRVPDGLPMREVLASLETLVRRQYPCYQRILSADLDERVLRCEDRAKRYRGMWEDVRVRADGADRRIYIMIVADVPDDPRLRARVDAILLDTQRRYRQ